MFASRRPDPAHSSADAPSGVELLVTFGSTPLSVEYLPLGRSFALSELLTERALPEDAPLLRGHGGNTWVRVPEGAEVVHRASDGARDTRALRALGGLVACIGDANAQELLLPKEGTIEVTAGTLRYSARRVALAEAPARAPITVRQHGWTLVSGLVHGVLLATLFFAPPPRRGLCMDALTGDDLRLVRTALLANELAREELFAPSTADGPSGKDGKRAEGDEGQAGSDTAPATKRHYAVKKTSDTPALPREAQLAQAATGGILGVIAAQASGMNAPTSMYGSDAASGYDVESAMGALVGAEVGASFGFGGLGMRSSGRGGGGDGQGAIGLGKLGTIGNFGRGEAGPGGYGTGRGGFAKRTERVPQIRTQNAEVLGGLSKETIRRVIQRHLNEVRFCYEEGLRARPELSGRVQVKFVVAPSGAVQAAEVAQTSLGAKDTEACIRDAVKRWSFPAPDGGGVVIVSYPFVLDSAG